ncbi:MAG: pyrimidine-nucleoside phosphorylase [Candidatus Wallbacteria bacterium]
MRAYDIILKKRNGGTLTREEIDFMITGYVKEEIKDYQMAAFLMAIYFKSMNSQETLYMTEVMAKSGDVVDLSAIHGVKVDKHSSGGVGDKTTLVVAPLCAACGVPVAKMSGRGLGHTGGTLDKLEAIPGFQINISPEKFNENVNKYKIAVVGQTANLVPADKKIYALRDSTATVDSIPLIASSIMSKKLAGGADAIVLDVKTGSGAFMQTPEEAIALAKAMVEIGNGAKRKTIALITDMDQPLGRAIGNTIEVVEAIDTLKGKGPSDLEELSIELAAHMLVVGDICGNYKDAKEKLVSALESGMALNKLRDMIKAQGGNPDVTENYGLMPKAKFKVEVLATGEGYVEKINAMEIGNAAMILGAGRAKKEDTIDAGVGLVMDKKVGDYVETGTKLVTIHANDMGLAKQAYDKILSAYSLTSRMPKIQSLIHYIVNDKGVFQYEYK